MPPKDLKNFGAVTLLRRTGTDPMMALVKSGARFELASNMTRMILKNVHLALMSRKQENLELNSTENGYAGEQRDGAAPALKWVRIAVIPDMDESRPTGSHWTESQGINYEASSKKWEGGLSAKTQKSKTAKKPAFVLKEVPYDDWRKHYAKDKFGRYRGLEEPAANCILLPEDEAKWRSEKTEAKVDPSILMIEEAPLPAGQIKRASTFPESQEVDEIGSTEKEEAIFVAEDGHTDSRMVEEPNVKFSSMTSASPPTSPIFLSPPTSPRG